MAPGLSLTYVLRKNGCLINVVKHGYSEVPDCVSLCAPDEMACFSETSKYRFVERGAGYVIHTVRSILKSTQHAGQSSKAYA
jgi:hypothetical protein